MNLNYPRLIPMQRDGIRLTAALTLMDGYYNGARIIQGGSALRLTRGVQPVKKSDALYAAVNLEPGDYPAQITAQYYFSVNPTIKIDLRADGIEPTQEIITIPITLEPRPGYPFPPGATLIQGSPFSDFNGLPAPGGVVRLLEDARIHSQIDMFGRFVLTLGESWSGSQATVLAFSREYGEGTAVVQPRSGGSVFVNIALQNLS